ncbi:phage tail assembly chaperone G [Staphylococcus carnosus]|uniref:phage tail assembly chaperone G n=1 Tax=Staphylococcus carnosus TaxID=1281 RepID=UPI000CD10D96|nr:hypothetical protein [Staphylococcus carnosus]POA05235.1 hypothetical protein CD153_03020 [Staphylococcus carnosus]QRQ05754.1 hypothetical protein I6J34_03545 [Staphylococcus carnosus]UTB82249.1 hypothetical protein A2I67_02605 [Staphylococcus carnosus]SUM07587.1 putative gp48 [Staphylococcus carnosus]GEP80630.1 hypothetical protein SCA05_24230 [Staphylococcus carnosus]
MIKFEIKNQETGKVESYSKEVITMGEAERFYEWMESREKEVKKEKPDMKKVRKMERDYLVSLFEKQSLTEEDILNNMGTKAYSYVLGEIFREISGEDETNSEDEASQEGKTEEHSQ